MATKTIHPHARQISHQRPGTSHQLGKLQNVEAQRVQVQKLQIQGAYVAAMRVWAPALNLVA